MEDEQDWITAPTLMESLWSAVLLFAIAALLSTEVGHNWLVG